MVRKAGPRPLSIIRTNNRTPDPSIRFHVLSMCAPSRTCIFGTKYQTQDLNQQLTPPGQCLDGVPRWDSPLSRQVVAENRASTSYSEPHHSITPPPLFRDVFPLPPTLPIQSPVARECDWRGNWAGNGVVSGNLLPLPPSAQ
jgi:hypothetical protein